MPGSSGEKLCPICDSPLQPGSKKCGFCGTDLTIFDIDVGKPAPTQPEAPKQSIDSLIKEVMAAPGVREPPKKEVVAPPAREEPSETAASFVSEPEPTAEPESGKPMPDMAAGPSPEPKVTHEEPAPGLAEAHEYFECPECGAKVDVNSRSCPGCGVMFAEEGTEVFECPACKSLVGVDATTCPGCGAMFVEPEEQPEESPSGPEISSAQAPAELEPPISEVRAHPPRPVQETPAPRPSPMIVPEPVPEPAKEPEEKKGKRGFGWFRKQKKEEAAEEVPEEEVPGLATVQEAPKAPAAPRLEATPQPSGWGVQARPEPTAVEGKDKGRELARMVAEIKPILTLANEKDIDIAESKRLIDEAAAAGRDRQLEKALTLVSQARSILMARIDERMASTVTALTEEMKVARELGGEVSRAATYLAEVEKAKAAGDAEAAFVYAQKVSHELLPITGRYNESKGRIKALKSLVADCEALIFDTKDARAALTDASIAFDAKDFDKVELLVKQASDRLYRGIPDRINEEMHLAKSQLIEAKMKNVNTGPLITTLKSVRTLMKAGDYQQAIKEMREFKEQIKKVT